jgi:hypothetical protein
MKKHLIIILLAIVGLCLGSLGMNGFASEEKGSEIGKVRKPAEDHRINAFMTKKIIGHYYAYYNCVYFDRKICPHDVWPVRDGQ